jgi:hypothetical protein
MYEQTKDKNLSIPENITKLVLEAKLKNLPFAVLKKGVQNIFTEKDFDKYNEYIAKTTSEEAKTRVVIEEANLKFFPMWDEIQKALTKIYGNPTTPYNSLMQTWENRIGKVHARLHGDTSDVVHLCCYGTVEWLLIDRENKNQHRITMEPGDVLYMRGFTLHETVPLTSRGSLIFMNLPLEDYPEPVFKTEEEKKDFFAKQAVELSDYRPIV